MILLHWDNTPVHTPAANKQYLAKKGSIYCPQALQTGYAASKLLVLRNHEN